MRLEFGVKAVLATLLLVYAAFAALEKDYAATLIARRKVVAGMVEFDCRDNVGLGNVIDLSFITKALSKAPAS